MIQSERLTNGWTLIVTCVSDAGDAEAILDVMEQAALGGHSAAGIEEAGMTAAPDYLVDCATIAFKGNQPATEETRP